MVKIFDQKIKILVKKNYCKSKFLLDIKKLRKSKFWSNIEIGVENLKEVENRHFKIKRSKFKILIKKKNLKIVVENRHGGQKSKFLSKFKITKKQN